MLIIRGGINSKKRELCPTALTLSAFYYNKNKHADTYIMYLHAYSTSGASVRFRIDNIKPREQNSLPPAIEVRADGNSDICFARLCFIWKRTKRHTKVPKLSHDLRTQSVECSKLGKTRIIEDANIRLVRNSTFFEPNIPSAFPHEIPKCVSDNITYQSKARYAYCDSSIFRYGSVYEMFRFFYMEI